MSEPHRRHRTLGAGVILAVMPGADETAEEDELAGVLADRGGGVERRDQPRSRPGRIHFPGHQLPPKRPHRRYAIRSSLAARRADKYPSTWEESAELLSEPVAASHPATGTLFALLNARRQHTSRYPRPLGYRNTGRADSVSTALETLSQRAHGRRYPGW